MSKNHILEFWENQAKDHHSAHSASWSDIFMVELERDFIQKTLQELSPNNAIDCGTSNGHSLIQLAKLFPHIKFSGFDFSPEMVSKCNNAINVSKSLNIAPATIDDVTDIKHADSSFDFTFTTRVLINLPTWQDQIKGINEMLRITRSNGTVLIMEGFWEPLINLNALRQISRLEPLVEHDFNRYLKLSRVRKILKDLKVEFSIIDFSSSYYLMTRFVRESIGAEKIDMSYESEFNHLSKQIHQKFTTSSNSGLGVQQAIIIKKA